MTESPSDAPVPNISSHCRDISLGKLDVSANFTVALCSFSLVYRREPSDREQIRVHSFSNMADDTAKVSALLISVLTTPVLWSTELKVPIPPHWWIQGWAAPSPPALCCFPLPLYRNVRTPAAARFERYSVNSSQPVTRITRSHQPRGRVCNRAIYMGA